MIKKLYRNLINYDLEEKKLLSYLDKYSRGAAVLDVGCGYGRMLKLLKANGINAIGVDINPEIVALNCREGLNCLSLTDFASSLIPQKSCDAINKIEILDVWYKKYSYRPTHQRFVYLPQGRLLMLFINALSALVFKMTFGVVGKKDGWAGVFRKAL